MTTTLKSTIGAQLGWTWREQLGTSTISDSNRLQFSRDLGDSSDTYRAEAIWHGEDQTLTTGQSTILQLDALEQPLFGDTITIPLVRVKAVLIVNKATSTGDHLLVGGSGAEEWFAPFGAPGDTVKVMPDSPLILTNTLAGWPVDATNRLLKVAAVGGDASFDMAILGTLTEPQGSSSSAGA